jgi:hypothetical protein
VGRTLLSDAFDVAFDFVLSFAFDFVLAFAFAFDLDFAREGHGLSHAQKESFERARLQATP